MWVPKGTSMIDKVRDLVIIYQKRPVKQSYHSLTPNNLCQGHKGNTFKPAGALTAHLSASYLITWSDNCGLLSHQMEQ